MRRTNSRKRNFLFAVSILSLLAGSLCLAGCSHTPKIYKVDPQKSEHIRGEIGTVGVVIAPYLAQTKVVRPARGWWGGVKRGFIVGATTPIVIGFVSPVPGGTLFGAMVAPFTAVAGSVYGITKSVPADTVDATEEVLSDASDRLRGMALRESFVENIVLLGIERTGVKFVNIQGAGPKSRDKEVNYAQLTLPPVDTILEIRAEKSGLIGRFSFDPPSSAFIELRVRLIRVADNKILIDETLSCESEDRKFVDWGKKEGQYFIDAFTSCVPRLAEKIVDDLFLVRPIASR